MALAEPTAAGAATAARATEARETEARAAAIFFFFLSKRLGTLLSF